MENRTVGSDTPSAHEKYELKIFTPYSKLTLFQSEKLADFLYEHLDEFGDERHDIMACISYAMKERSAEGGLALVLYDGTEIIGAVIINKTGMTGYIPENILVYIALHRDYRGQGLGKLLMKNAISATEGDIALHVEPDNPAKFLYEKVGFTNKYLEMRFKRH
jgi:ribosomal protein S18 acetylase RimI-like enzyme